MSNPKIPEAGPEAGAATSLAAAPDGGADVIAGGGAGSDAACCPPLAVRALTPELARSLAPMFKALGDPARLRLLSMIASTTEACVCDLTSAFDLSGPTISHHLRVLREAGLVDSERRGTWVYYWVDPTAMNQLGGLLRVADTVPA